MASATQAHQLSNGMVPLLNQITNHLKATNPNASHEQIKQMATMQLNNHLRNQNSQAAANLGVNGGMAMLPGQHALGFSSGQINPQVYAQMMRNQQASQQSRNTNGDVNGARPSSQGSVQAKRNSNGSSVGAPNASQSPRPPQAQLAGQS